MPDLELSVTICSWNTREDLHQCLSSLEAVRGEAEFEVIVIDNNSEDRSAEMVTEHFPWVRLFPQGHNLGFTGGHNFALKKRSAYHAFLLNSDTVVHPGAFRTLLDFAAANPKAGMIGPKLLNPDGSLQYSCRTWPSPAAALFRNTLLGKIWPNNPFTRDYLMTNWPHDLSRSVDWVSGAAFLVRGEVIDEIGLMDEDYFMFCEDVDWCWRARKAGFDILYFPQSVITHAIGRSTDKAPNRMIGRFHRSMLRFYQKNMVKELNPLLRPFALAFAASALAARAAVFIAKNRLDDIRLRRKR